MDKITGIAGPKQITSPQRSIRNKEAQFKDTFNEVTKQKQTPLKTEQPLLGVLGEVRAPVPPILNQDGQDLAKKSNNLLDLLNSYADDIANPNKSLKDIEPLIHSIKDRADRLLKDSVAVPGDNPQLSEIAERTAVMANVEYLKFLRGDYI